MIHSDSDVKIITYEESYLESDFLNLCCSQKQKEFLSMFLFLISERKVRFFLVATE